MQAADPSAGWDAFLLVTSIALVAFSARTARRGPGLVGAAGIVAFIVIVGGQLGDVLAGKADHTLSGWPLTLLIGGAAGLALSFLVPRGAIGRLLGREQTTARDSGPSRPSLPM